MGSCAMLADRYVKQFPDLKPPLNRDIVLASAVLHDIGRVRDIQLNAPGLPADAVSRVSYSDTCTWRSI